MKLQDRRSFLTQALAAGMVASILPNRLLASGQQDQSNHIDKIKDNNLVFLFQGDSITDGARGRNYKDLNHIMGHGYAFTIASRVGADFPEKELTFINRGVSGNKVTDLAARWQEDALDLKPDVLSILVGINDSGSVLGHKPNPVSVELYEETYKKLLDQTKEKFPGILFVLCEPFAVPLNRDTTPLSDRVVDVMARQAIVKKLAVQYDAVYVPFQEVFDKALSKAPAKYWNWDSIHPTVAGHELMAREWLRQVSKRIKFLKKEF